MPHLTSHIEESAKLFGESAREPAKQHIISGLKEEEWADSNPNICTNN